MIVLYGLKQNKNTFSVKPKRSMKLFQIAFLSVPYICKQLKGNSIAHLSEHLDTSFLKLLTGQY